MENIKVINLKSVEAKMVEIAKEVHPFYRDIRPDVYQIADYISLGINYDRFGKIYMNEDGTFKAKATGHYGVGVIKERCETIREAIEHLLHEYFH